MNTPHPFLAALYGVVLCIAVAALGFYPFQRPAAQRIGNRSRRDIGR